MFNINYIIPFVCFWYTISTETSKYKPVGVSANFCNFLNSIFFIAHHHYTYNLDYVTHMSIGFYTYDLLYMFSCVYKANANANANANEELKRHLPYILHHLAGIFLLHEALTSDITEHVLNGYNILETSNIMLYISYHIHKEYANYIYLNITSEFIQLIWYSYYRIVYFSLFIYSIKTDVLQFYLTTQCLIFAVFCMGGAWSYKLCKKNIKNFNALKDQYGNEYGPSITPDSKLN